MRPVSAAASCGHARACALLPAPHPWPQLLWPGICLPISPLPACLSAPQHYPQYAEMFSAIDNIINQANTVSQHDCCWAVLRAARACVGGWYNATAAQWAGARVPAGGGRSLAGRRRQRRPPRPCRLPPHLPHPQQNLIAPPSPLPPPPTPTTADPLLHHARHGRPVPGPRRGVLQELRAVPGGGRRRAAGARGEGVDCAVLSWEAPRLGCRLGARSRPEARRLLSSCSTQPASAGVPPQLPPHHCRPPCPAACHGLKQLPLLACRPRRTA